MAGGNSMRLFITFNTGVTTVVSFATFERVEMAEHDFNNIQHVSA